MSKSFSCTFYKVRLGRGLDRNWLYGWLLVEVYVGIFKREIFISLVFIISLICVQQEDFYEWTMKKVQLFFSFKIKSVMFDTIWWSLFLNKLVDLCWWTFMQILQEKCAMDMMHTLAFDILFSYFWSNSFPLL